MMAFTGLAKIVRFNWPWYAAAAVVYLDAIWALRSGALAGACVPLALIGIAEKGYLTLSLVTAMAYKVTARCALLRWKQA